MAGFTTPYGTPAPTAKDRALSPADALAEFFGMQGDPNRGDYEGLHSNPAVDLASLRGQREAELKEQLVNDTAAGDKFNAGRSKSFLDMLASDEASDPYTGTAARLRDEKQRELMNQDVALGEPTNPIAKEEAGKEALALQQTIAAHPSTSGMPGPSINVPGAVPVNPGYSTSVGAGPHADPDSVLASQPPEVAATVRGLLNYTQPMPGGNARARYPFVQAMALAQQLDPTFDVTNYEPKQKFKSSLVAGGPNSLGDRLRALNQFAGHVTDLDQQREELGNWNTGAFLNGPINAFEKHVLGAGKFNKFDTTRGNVVSELGRFMGGVNPTNELRQMIGGDVTSSSSDDQIQGFIDAVGELASRAYDSAVQQGNGMPGMDDLIKQHIGPAAQQLLEYVAHKRGVR